MNRSMNRRHWDTIVIGGGQAGLAAGYHLKQRGREFIILDSELQVGDAWRRRWDSLRLFTPSQHDGLPGMPFPGPSGAFPAKDEVAEYLVQYTGRFSLPVEPGVRVSRLIKTTAGFAVTAGNATLTADHVIVATGTNPSPRIPEFAQQLNPSISQIHSSEYKNPDSLPAGETLVVGAGTSGVEIAIELASSRRTFLSGKPTFHIPDPLLRYAGEAYWLFISHVLTVQTPIGRKARKDILKGGGPLIRVSVKEVDAAGVERVLRVTGVHDGHPQLADGRVVPVKSVVWCTGFRPDFSWIEMPVVDESGWPRTERGISEVDGLYFVGMLFQFGLTSGLIGGVGRDAQHVVEHLHQHH